MPASRLCQNFAALEWVPVSEPVPQRYPKHPHEYCAKGDHNRCFEVYVYSGFWYAHSVEELVVWTVEKEFQSECVGRVNLANVWCVLPVLSREGCLSEEYFSVSGFYYMIVCVWM